MDELASFISHTLRQSGYQPATFDAHSYNSGWRNHSTHAGFVIEMIDLARRAVYYVQPPGQSDQAPVQFLAQAGNILARAGGRSRTVTRGSLPLHNTPVLVVTDLKEAPRADLLADIHRTLRQAGFWESRTDITSVGHGVPKSVMPGETSQGYRLAWLKDHSGVTVDYTIGTRFPSPDRDAAELAEQNAAIQPALIAEFGKRARFVKAGPKQAFQGQSRRFAVLL